MCNPEYFLKPNEKQNKSRSDGCETRARIVVNPSVLILLVGVMAGNIFLTLYKNTFPSAMGLSLPEITGMFSRYRKHYKDPVFLCSDFSKFESANSFDLLNLCSERKIRLLKTKWKHLFADSEHTDYLQWLLDQYIECQRVGTMTDKRDKEIPTKNSERFIVDVGMGNSTSSGQPVYTMDNSQFNMLYHLQIIEKYLTEKLGHCVDPLDYVTTIEHGVEIIRDFTCIFMGDDAVLAFCREKY